MTHPIIKTDNYILITSDEEIKEGDYWHYLGEKIDPIKTVLDRSWFEKLHDLKMYKKVIAHLPLNNEPQLEGVPLLPPLPNEDDVEKLAEKEFPHISTDERIRYLTILLRDGFVTGHKKAKEKYKFTEEDMRKIFEVGIGLSSFSGTSDSKFQYALKFLSQPKLPVGFKCEIEVECTGNDNNGCFMDAPGHNCGCVKTKIVNGVMQGEWIF